MASKRRFMMVQSFTPMSVNLRLQQLGNEQKEEEN